MKLTRRNVLALAAAAPVAAAMPALPVAPPLLFVETAGQHDGIPTQAQIDQVYAALLYAYSCAYQVPIHILEGRSA